MILQVNLHQSQNRDNQIASKARFSFRLLPSSAANDVIESVSYALKILQCMHIFQ